MRKRLTADDLAGLLEQPLLAVLGTIRRTGSVMLSPVWYEWRDGGFNVVTGHDDGKARHLRRDPRASIVVCEQVPPYAGLEVRARAQLRPVDDPAMVARIAARYLGPEAGGRYAESGQDDLLIRIEPGELRGWDFRDDFG